jgi:4-oxalocrotonate tautomerase
MPHVIVKMVAGRSEEQKRALAAEVTRALMSSLGSPEEAISVAIEDIAADDWTDQVYVPDIQGRTDFIYKKPGYDPFK